MVSTQLLSIRKNIIFIMQFRNGIWLPDGDTWIHWGEKWERGQYKKLKLRGNLCLDIGAHVGIWSQRLSKDFSKVICFEPLTKHIECHKRNCENFDNITLHEYALSDVETESIMTTTTINSGMSTLENRRMRNKQQVKIKTKKLDSFNIDEIDFMKIDVEGHEEKVLLGAKNTIYKYYPKIFIEIWPKNFERVSKIIIDMNYAMRKIAENNYLCEKINENTTTI